MNALVLAAALVLQARDPIDWSKSIEDAKKASGGKKPIAVFLSQKGCALSGEFFRNLVKDDRLPELAAGFAWLPVVVGTDEYRSWFLKTCGANAVGTPTLLFLNPKGENADPDYAGLGAVTSPDPDDVIPMLREVLQRAKQSEPDKDKARVKEAVEKAKGAATAGEAVAAWRQALRAGDGWRGEAEAMAEARAGIEKRLQEGGAEMVRIQATVRDPKEQLKAFEAVKAGWAGTSIADWASEEAARVRKSLPK